MTNYKDLEASRALKLWHSLPETLKVSVWVGVSAGATATISYLLDKPEYMNYYGVLNILLFAIKEIGKSIRKK